MVEWRSPIRRRPGRASPAPTSQTEKAGQKQGGGRAGQAKWERAGQNKGDKLGRNKGDDGWCCPLVRVFGGLVAEDVEAAFQIVLDEFEFFRGVAGSVLEGGGSQALIKAADALEGFEAGADKDFAAVAGIAEAFDEARFFEAVEDAGDGAGGQTGMAGDVAGGERPPLGITGHQFKASGISNVEPQPGGDRLVEEDGSGAELAAEFHANADDQGVALAGASGPAEFIQFDAVHFILTPNYLTN